jgi:hypothetical protein
MNNKGTLISSDLQKRITSTLFYNYNHGLQKLVLSISLLAKTAFAFNAFTVLGIFVAN